MLKKLWIKYKEYILYLIFGGLTTLVSWGSFYVCAHWLQAGTILSNIISWICAVAAAYITNRKWVFESRAQGLSAVVKEILRFTGARLLTLIIETVLLWLSVDVWNLNDMLMKIIISTIIVVLNYVFSRFMVFHR